MERGGGLGVCMCVIGYLLSRYISARRIMAATASRQVFTFPSSRLRPAILRKSHAALCRCNVLPHLPPIPPERKQKEKKDILQEQPVPPARGCLLLHPVGLLRRRGVLLLHFHLISLSRRRFLRRRAGGWGGSQGIPPTAWLWRRRPPSFALLLGLPLPRAHVGVCEMGSR